MDDHKKVMADMTEICLSHKEPTHAIAFALTVIVTNQIETIKMLKETKNNLDILRSDQIALHNMIVDKDKPSIIMPH